MSGAKRCAIVTPYFREERSLLERCIQSVRDQIVPAEHFMVADGHPQDWIDSEAVRHIRLDRSHGDYGNAARGAGALLAIAEGYEGIGLLDADNWFEKNHTSLCLEAAQGDENRDYIIAQRNLCRPDGSVIDVHDEHISNHVDTSCFFLLPGSYHMIPYFSLMPVILSPICDRVFYAALKSRNLNAHIVREKTVNYQYLYKDAYRAAGETPPANAKPDADIKSINDWLNGRDPRELEIVNRRCGIPGRPQAAPAHAGIRF